MPDRVMTSSKLIMVDQSTIACVGRLNIQSDNRDDLSGLYYTTCADRHMVTPIEDVLFSDSMSAIRVNESCDPMDVNNSSEISSRNPLGRLAFGDIIGLFDATVVMRDAAIRGFYIGLRLPGNSNEVVPALTIRHDMYYDIKTFYHK